MKKNELTVQESEVGLRIDKLLVTNLNDISRSKLKTWFEANLILVNGKPAKANYTVQKNDLISWQQPEIKPLEIEARDIPLEIVFEDEDLLVVNKPSGMVVHPSAGHQEDTLVNALLFHCNDLSGINGVARPGIVHRIDKDTSGLLMVAKNDKAHEALASQLQDKMVKRAYQLIVHGEIQHEFGTIDAPIGRSEKNRQLMDVVDKGKPAVTHFEVLERIHDKFTLVKCVLETGRTHQIRVHMKYIGFPLVGDPKYGPRKTIDVEGQALHAYLLGFKHPSTNEWMEFEAPLPSAFQTVLDNLKKSY
ncbi:RluA family pseudouridine synthase [Saliterribacillus persicus]|uniref:Pseudouridine synthase n=1 Tax=Saliterribacillus persicus TaxID=930114 RepID=A0A368XS48_9BACI|nr:RluA family pseudouridine synthase [Saliterribacillus persicus]RCW70782.1 ribosomal large subunit pseudouridine synthase D [Saliterribacillus persicus]